MIFRVWNMKEVNANEAEEWYEEVKGLFKDFAITTISCGIKSLKFSEDDNCGYDYDATTKIVKACFMFEDSDTGHYFARCFNNSLKDAQVEIEICFE